MDEKFCRARAALMRPMLLVLVAASGGCGGSERPTGVPAAEPTHHALVTGRVLGASGLPLDSVEVGSRFAESSPTVRQASVSGGTTVAADGSYTFEILSDEPPAPDGRIDAFIAARRPNPAGVLEDSVLVTVLVVPSDRTPPLTPVPTITLPDR